jgi:polyisoprenyl-teichoic acid--peptidoglycan teichoic acid transferase
MTSPLRPPAPPPPAPPDPPAQRAWVKRAIVGFLIVANLAVFGTLGAIWLAARQVSEAISTIPAGELPLTRPPAGALEPRTFLLVGSDRREGLPPEFDHTGRFGGQRADVIMLLTVRPRQGAVQMLSIPRDLKITFNGRTSRINATFNNGAGDVVQAVSELIGGPIHHYMEVDFGGFASIVDAIGGVRMTFPYPARDLKANLSVDAGTQILDGQAALALSRSRGYQELRNGGWVNVDANDFGRTRRQQDVLMAIMTQIEPPSSAAGFSSLVSALGEFVVTDSNFREDEIIQLAWSMRNFSSNNIDAATLPGRTSLEGGVSYVVRVEPEATEMIAAFNAGRPIGESVVGRDAVIEVTNGNGRPGSAALVGDLLIGGGFNVASTTSSPRSDYQTTLVVARPHHLSAAEAVVAFLGYGRATVGRTPTGVDLVVIVGLDAPSG